jgi:hypothetical protein
MKPTLLAALLAALALLAAACGGGDGDGASGDNDGADDDPTEDASVDPGGDQPRTSVTPSGPPLSDEEYLRVFCSGVTTYREAVNTANRDELIQVVQDYLDSMAAVNPPEDLQQFHTELLGYLDDALDEPTYLLTRNPPVPEESVRSRMAEKSADIDECQYPVFLGGQ